VIGANILYMVNVDFLCCDSGHSFNGTHGLNIKKWIPLCCTVVVEWVTVMDVLNFNSLVNQSILLSKLYDIIAIKVICVTVTED